MYSSLEEELCCPVCLDIFTDPVLLTCAHNVCEVCLQKYWEKTEAKDCPVCRRRASKNIIPNFSLKSQCEKFLQEKTSWPSFCSLHSEELKLFCLDHQQPVCLSCRDTDEHRGHMFKSVEESAQKHKLRLHAKVKALKERLKVSQQVKENFAQTDEHIRIQVQHTERQIKECFQKFHHFLTVEEEARISALRKEEDEKLGLMNLRMEALSRDIAALSNTIAATEEELRADDVEFLQSCKATVEKVQGCIQTVDLRLPHGALVDQARHLSNLSFNLWHSMTDSLYYSPLTLDPNTAGAGLILSDDLTSVRQGEKQMLPDNPERLQNTWSVLGSQGYSSGTHSWDVQVGNSSYWELGVLAESAHKNASMESGLWTLFFSNGEYTAVCPSHPETVLQMKKTFQRIRVNLDRSNGKLSFYDSDTNTHIHTFRQSFTERMFPLIRTVSNRPLKVSTMRVSEVYRAT